MLLNKFLKFLILCNDYYLKFLIDLIIEQIKLENIKQLKIHFYDYSTFFNNIANFPQDNKKNNNEIQKKVFAKSLKGYSFLLKLMKNVTTKISDEKNYGRLLNKLVEILTEFDLFSLITPDNINNYNLRETMFVKQSSVVDNFGKKPLRYEI